MRISFIALLCLLLAGCGSLSGSVAGSATLDTPAGPVQVTFALPAHGLRGSLPVALVLVDYADAACPYSEAQGAAVLQQLDQWVTRQSTGRAWVVGRVVRVVLPGAAESYAAPISHEDRTLSHPVQVATRALGLPERYQLFLLPPQPRSYVGAADPDWHGDRYLRPGWAWLGALEVDPLRLPLAHEFGHALGLGHGGGVMEQRLSYEWSDGLDAQALSALGWLGT